MINNNIDIAAIKAKRERQEKQIAEWARKYDGARLAEEWKRKDFACFIRRTPKLNKLTDNELRALFLKYHGYDPTTGKRLYTRVTNLWNWRRMRPNNTPEYDIALNGLTGDARKAEWERINHIWDTL